MAREIALAHEALATGAARLAKQTVLDGVITDMGGILGIIRLTIEPCWRLHDDLPWA